MVFVLYIATLYSLYSVFCIAIFCLGAHSRDFCCGGFFFMVVNFFFIGALFFMVVNLLCFFFLSRENLAEIRTCTATSPRDTPAEDA